MERVDVCRRRELQRQANRGQLFDTANDRRRVKFTLAIFPTTCHSLCMLLFLRRGVHTVHGTIGASLR